MPWEKQFDIDESLIQAMQVFWRKGYAATSMQDLGKAMDLHPGSIYATYGNKHSLFLKALNHYETCFGPGLKALEEALPPREAILAPFKGVIDETLKDPNYSGCFLLNSTLEMAPHDDEVKQIVNRGLARAEDFFKRMIKKGQKTGDISADISPTQTARVLLGLLSGLRVLSHGRPERTILRTLASQAEELLG